VVCFCYSHHRRGGVGFGHLLLKASIVVSHQKEKENRGTYMKDGCVSKASFKVDVAVASTLFVVADAEEAAARCEVSWAMDRGA
jgi:acetone carboxylase gamma subunit